MGIDGRPLPPSMQEALWALRRILDPKGPEGPLPHPLADPGPREREREQEIALFKSALFSAFTAARSAGLGIDYAARYAARRAQRAATALTISEMLAQLRTLAPLS